MKSIFNPERRMLTPDDLKDDEVFLSPKIYTAPEQPFRSIDIELSNHCNALCYYCPRDLVNETGFMSEAVFRTIIDQACDYPEEILLGSCGHGESILHPDVGKFITYARSKSSSYGLHTNGSLLTAERRRILLDAGLTTLRLSVSATGELYEQMYRLKFDPVLKNIKEFIREARGACSVGVYIVKTDLNKMLIKDYKAFWEDVGVDHCDVFPVINRSGSIPYKNLIYSDKSLSENSEAVFKNNNLTNFCHSPVFGNFVGWDGYHYLCSHDWEKAVKIGHVSNTSLKQAFELKLDYQQNSHPSLCETCDWNIKNRINECIRHEKSSDYLPLLLDSRKKEEAMIKKTIDKTLGRISHSYGT